MHYFLLVIFYAGTHLVTSTPLLRFLGGLSDLLYARRVLLEGESLALGKSYSSDEVLVCLCVFLVLPGSLGGLGFTGSLI